MSNSLPFPLTILSLARIGVGTSAFLFPSLTTNLLFSPQPQTSLFHTRAWGSRDALLGVLLYTAKTPEARRRALMVGAAVDVLDVASAVWYVDFYFFLTSILEE
jgi:hypothetical protein